jgi:hypothetical protein
MRSTYVPVISLLALGLAATAATAQQIPSPYRYVEETMSVGLEAGFFLPQALTPDIGPSAAPTVGARYLIRIGGPVSGEVATAFIPTRREIYQNTAATAGEVELESLGTASTPLLLAEAGFRLHLTGPRTWNQLAPYLSSTAGGAFNLAGSTEQERELPTVERFTFGPTLTISAGAGTDYFVGERISLRVDARNRLWRMTVPQGLIGAVRGDARWTNNFTVTLGAAYHF